MFYSTPENSAVSFSLYLFLLMLGDESAAKAPCVFLFLF